MYKVAGPEKMACPDFHIWEVLLMVNQESLGGSHGSPSLTNVDLIPELLPFNVPKNE
jgi:hypothetical protein